MQTLLTNLDKSRAIIAESCDDAAMDIEDQPRAYPGGKGKAYPHIINLMPPHSTYIETHLGGGAVMRNKRSAARNIGIEVDPAVIERWSKCEDRGFELIPGDAVEILSTLDITPDTLIYCDPPYLPTTRRRSRIYRHDYDEADHERLLMLLRSMPARIILSGYPSDLYDRLLEAWTVTELTVQTHTGAMKEHLWTNYKPGPVLHDYSFVGFDFREREAVRRRLRTVCSKLGRAEEVERRAVFDRLARAHPKEFLEAAERIR